MNRTVQQLRRDLRSKALTAVQVYEQSLNRVQEISDLNAFVSFSGDIGKSQAEAVDARLRIATSRPLDGVPIAVKDNFCVHGLKATCGSRMLLDFVPPYTATIVSRLLDAGAVLVGKTNLDEFGMGSGCIDSIHGHTVNAWDSSCIAGGSSGGSAVAVASGAVLAAIGSDTGGSTRNPSAYNGVVGLKPTYGRLSRHGLIPLVNSMDVPGIIARTVDDTAELLNITSGWDERDSTTVQTKPLIHLSDEFDVRGLTVGIPKEYLTTEIALDVVETWKDVAKLLSESGAKVIEVSLPHTQHSIACYSVLNQCEVASNMARYDGIEFGFRGDDTFSTEQLFAQTRALALGAVVRRRILCGNYFLLAKNYERYFTKAMSIRRLIANDFNSVWAKNVNVLLTPVTLSDAPTLKDFLSRDARSQSATQDYCTQPVNMVGVPAITIPIRLSSRGLPIGLQLISPHFEEEILLSVARFIERQVCFYHHRTKK